MSLLNYFPFDQLPLSFLMLGLKALFVLTFKSFIINKLITIFFYFCVALLVFYQYGVTVKTGDTKARV